MSRTSIDQVDKDGRVINGYDYQRQAWVVDGKYIACGHPEKMNCGCYGRAHAGEKSLVDETRVIREEGTCIRCLCSSCRGECPAPCRALYQCEAPVTKCQDYRSKGSERKTFEPRLPSQTSKGRYWG